LVRTGRGVNVSETTLQRLLHIFSYVLIFHSTPCSICNGGDLPNQDKLIFHLVVPSCKNLIPVV
jgi:hypothetical protein